MIEFFHEHRVRYREADPMGIVYHTHYLDYFEVARTEALRDVGLPYKSLEDGGVFMPVVDLALSYKRPAKYDDLLVIRTQMTMSESATRVTFDYEVVRKGETDVLVTGHVTLCFFDRKTHRPVRAPEHIASLINEYASSEST